MVGALDCRSLTFTRGTATHFALDVAVVAWRLGLVVLAGGDDDGGGEREEDGGEKAHCCGGLVFWFD
jgi:hypothetical protein